MFLLFSSPMKMGSVPVSPKCAKLNTFLLNLIDLLKALDTVGNCIKTSIFTWCISTYAQNNNLWKFWRNWSSKLRENNGRKIPFVTQVAVLSDAFNLRPQLRSRIQFKYLSEKLLLSQKVCYFRESRFSQSTALHYLLPSKFLC